MKQMPKVRIRGRYSNSFSYESCRLLSWRKSDDHEGGFEKESYRLLGAQIIGYEGVDKRIDVLATAIHAGLNATQLKDLDLAYAPPYSSAKDPVNMAGFMIDNIAKGH